MAASLESCSLSVRNLLAKNDVCQPREMVHDLHAINNYIDHLQLDRALLAASPQWHMRQNVSKMNRFANGTSAALGNTNAAINSLNVGMTFNNASTLPDNITRHYCHSANQTFGAARQGLHPFAADSRERIHQYCDLIGVTDRFNGYRHNMTRNRQNFKLGTSWARQSLPEPQIIYQANECTRDYKNERFNLESPTNFAGNADGGAYSREKKRDRQLVARHDEIESRDMRTDYMRSYTLKIKPPFGEQQFPINPAIDFSRAANGRPVAPAVYEKRVSEYTNRYKPPLEQLDVRRRFLSSRQ